MYGQVAWNQQHSWWLKNGKHFQIMDLPAELRLMILKQAVGHRHYPALPSHPDFRALFWYCGVGPEAIGWRAPGGSMFFGEELEEPNINILLAHPVLYNEIYKFITTGAPKGFVSTVDLHSWIHGPLAHVPEGFGSIRHLHLDFSHEEYIGFFQVDVTPFRHTGPPAASILSSLTHLTSLQLYFRSPSDTMDPWGYTGHLNGYTDLQDFQGNCDNNFLTSCQKILLDWILTFAKRYIDHIPRVALSGYIKNSTKFKWESILRDRYSGAAYDFDEKVAKEAIGQWPRYDLPPRCKCSALCACAGASVQQHKDECNILGCKTCSRIIDGSPRARVGDYEFEVHD